MLSRLITTWKKFNNPNNVLVYQMGKVGSTTLEDTIPDSIHVHSLYNNFPCQLFFDQTRQGIKKYLLWFGDKIKITAIRRRKEVKIITLVRDPYKRNISMFFQDLAYWIYLYGEKGARDTRSDSFDFLFKVYDESFDHDYVNKWFDKEIKRLTNIDVYEKSFPKEDGYQIYKKGKYTVLLIECSKLESNMTIVEEFVGKNLDYKRTNDANNKWYSSLYSEFKKKYVTSDKVKSIIENGKYYKHFYE